MRALVVAPTRELVAQIEENVRAYARHLPLKCATIFGGVGEGPQIRALRQGVDIVVATPGRLLDLMEQRHVDFADLEVLVLDEADRMLDMGFLPPIRRIVGAAAEETPDAALLGDDVEGDRGGHARISSQPDAGADRRAVDAGRDRDAVGRSRSRSPEARRARAPAAGRRARDRCWCSRARSMAPTASRRKLEGGGIRRRPCTPTARRASACAP